MKYLLGCDPGLAKFGIVVTDININLKEFACIVTKKQKNKTVSQGDFERSQQLFRDIMEVIEPYKGDLVLACVESFSSPRHASSAAKLARAWGVLASIAEHLEVPLIMESPKGIKKAVTGRSGASKSDMKSAVEEMGYKLPEFSNKSHYEHPVDALSAILACKNKQIFRMARQQFEL